MLLFPSLLLSLLMRDLLKMCARLKSEDMDIFVWLVESLVFSRIYGSLCSACDERGHKFE